MHIRNSLLLSGVLAALVISSQAPAAASHQCSQLWDDLLRLSCYDTAFGKPRPPAETAVLEAPPLPTASPPVVAASAAPAVAATTPAPAAATATAPAGKEKAKAPQPVKSVVTVVGQTLDGRFRATLENGQIWQQIEIDSRVQVKVGDQVTVRNASMGSRQMVLPGGMVVRVSQAR